MMEEIMCPHCFQQFEVEEYSSGECPSCHRMEYYWEEYWDEENEYGGWMGFEWDVISNERK